MNGYLKKKRTWIILGVAILFSFWLKSHRAKSSAADFPSTFPLKLAKSVFVDKVQAMGVAEPENRVQVIPTFGGRIDKILVQEGDAVREGQVLAWMSSNERASLLDAAKVNQASAEEIKTFEGAYQAAPLVAPISGTVIARAVEPGQPVTAAQAVLVLSDRLIIRTAVDETDIGKVKEGQEAEFSLDAFPKEAYSAKVVHIAHEAKLLNNVTVYEVKVLPRRKPAFLRSGMTANVRVIVETKPNALVIPKEAVKYIGGNPTVMLLKDPLGKPSAQIVQLGSADKKRFEIVSGLSEGETILVSSAAPKNDGSMTISIGN